MNLRSVLSHRTAQSQPQWLPSWTSLQRFREISIRLWKDKQIRVSHWTHTGQTEATPGIFKDNSNCQKLTAVHRSPSSKCQTGDTDFGPWKLDVVRVFSDNPISSNAASSREGMFPWGLGQEVLPTGSTCCVPFRGSCCVPNWSARHWGKIISPRHLWNFTLLPSVRQAPNTPV